MCGPGLGLARRSPRPRGSSDRLEQYVVPLAFAPSLILWNEGAGFLSLRASVKRCPICGAKAENGNGRRRFTHCGFEFDRDFTACYNLTLTALRVLKAEEKAVEALKDWLRQHPKALI